MLPPEMSLSMACNLFQVIWISTVSTDVLDYCVLRSSAAAILIILTHWPLGDVVVILKVLFPNTCYRLCSMTILKM